MQKGEDPYEILGVPYDVEEDELKKVYRKLALTHHPDRQKDEDTKQKAHDEFARISEAYDVLTDPVKRYDWKLANERKLKGGGSNHGSNHGTSGSNTTTATRNKATPAAGTPMRQSTMPSKHVPRSTQPQRPRSSSPKPSKPKHSAPPPPSSSIFGRRTNAASNPHSQHPLNKKKQQQTQTRKQMDEFASVHSTRSSQTAPATPSSKQFSRKPSATATYSSSSTSYSATPGTREYVSPRPTSSSGATAGKKKFVVPNSAPAAAGGRRKVSVHGNRKGTAGGGLPTSDPLGVSSRHSTGAGSTQSKKNGTKIKQPARSTSLSSSMNGGARGTSQPPKVRSKSPRVGVHKRSGSDGLRTGSRTTSSTTKSSNHGDDDDYERKMKQKFSEKMQQHSKLRDHALGSKTALHDIFGVFEKKLQQYFEQDYWESDWKNEASKGMKKGKVITAITVGNENDPKTVASMTTATKLEKRGDNLYNVKTVTKLLRLDGCVEKICQASVVDKADVKNVLEGSFTISREIALEKAMNANSKTRGGPSGNKARR